VKSLVPSATPIARSAPLVDPAAAGLAGDLPTRDLELKGKESATQVVSLTVGSGRAEVV